MMVLCCCCALFLRVSMVEPTIRERGFILHRLRAGRAFRLRASQALWAIVFLALTAQATAVESHAGYVIQEVSVQYERTDLYTGLPDALVARVEELLDGRLSASSQRSVDAAPAPDTVCPHGWLESSPPTAAKGGHVGCPSIDR